MGIFKWLFGKNRDFSNRRGFPEPRDTLAGVTARGDAQVGELWNVVEERGEVAQGLATSSGSGASGGEGAFLPFGQPADELKDELKNGGRKFG